MATVDQKYFDEMVQAVQALDHAAWRLQARLNVMELICLQMIEDVARARSDSRDYMCQYVHRASVRRFVADVDDPAKKEQTEKEMKGALENFLGVVLTRAGDI
jgi:hypothetical protein